MVSLGFSLAAVMCSCHFYYRRRLLPLPPQVELVASSVCPSWETAHHVLTGAPHPSHLHSVGPFKSAGNTHTMSDSLMRADGSWLVSQFLLLFPLTGGPAHLGLVLSPQNLLWLLLLLLLSPLCAWLTLLIKVCFS